MQPSLPIIFKSKASGDMVVPVLPHLRHFSFNFFELSLAPCFVCFVPIGSCCCFGLKFRH